MEDTRRETELEGSSFGGLKEKEKEWVGRKLNSNHYLKLSPLYASHNPSHKQHHLTQNHMAIPKKIKWPNIQMVFDYYARKFIPIEFLVAEQQTL